MTATVPATRPGRHRSQEADDAILSATLEVLRERGYGGLTMLAVIERAGVSSATLYRRWPTKPTLVTAAVQTLAAEPVPIDTGSLAGDLKAFLAQVARSYRARNELLQLLKAEQDEELTEVMRATFVAPRTAQLAAALEAAVARGEVSSPPPAEVALSLAVGPMYHRTALDLPLSPAFLRALHRHLLAGLTAS